MRDSAGAIEGVVVFLPKNPARSFVISFDESERNHKISASTLFRLENLEQSATLNSVSQILKRLKASPRDVFRDVGQKGP